MARETGSLWKVSVEAHVPNVRRTMSPLIAALSEVARNEWIREARQRLRTTARAYVNSILPVEHRGTKATIRLTDKTSDGQLANMLEQGHGPFDMKPGLLRSSKAKKTATGRPYIHVPFRHRVPGGGDRADVMPRPIYRLAKNLPAGTGLKLPPAISAWGMRTRLSPNTSKWGAYTWKSSPYAGIVRSLQFPGQLVSPSRYDSFRTVSRRSDPNSWIHPGFQARNLMEAAARNLERLAPEVFDRVLSETL